VVAFFCWCADETFDASGHDVRHVSVDFVLLNGCPSPAKVYGLGVGLGFMPHWSGWTTPGVLSGARRPESGEGGEPRRESETRSGFQSGGSVKRR